MKISASIYSNKNRSLEDLIKELDSVKIDMFHVDFNDQKTEIEKVEKDIIEIRKISNTPIDLHIISEKPNKYNNFIKKNKIEYVTYQVENIKENIIFHKSKDTSFGLAITSGTSIEKFEEYKSSCDFILLMTTTPGESGGTFNKINFKKIRDFKKKYPSKKIHIDGGVNDEISLILRIHGVKSVVSGSYLVNGNIAKSLLELKSSVSSSKMPVSDFMLLRKELPIIKENERIDKALEKIELYDFGCVFVENENNDFTGIVSMADVRKSLIKSLDNFKNLKVKDIKNSDPIVINKNDSINKMLKITQSHDFLISFVPVINNKELVGSVTFFNLIRSES
mgnify:FL=1|tara:strand:- start:8 stop:1018 length:1011 start_codon:yes stop_codon:yes gene_type:complete